MSKINVDTIDKQSGSTVTVGGPGTNLVLGTSGQSVTLGCGATQTGFGRTGTVNWCTTVKTSPLTVASGNGYFINTSGGAVTVTLPSSPSAGDIVSVADYAGTSGTNNIILARNGSKFEGSCTNGALNNKREAVTLIFVDSTQGWVAVSDNNELKLDISYIAASGGTETTSGDYKIHTFTASSNFVVSSVGNAAGSNKVSYMVIAGGGGGGGDGGGGGGAGGFREGKCTSDPYADSPLDAGAGLPVSAQSYPITVGGGGNGNANSPWSSTPAAISGTPSVFSSITSTGGGGTSRAAGAAGGSGGGSGRCIQSGTGGAGNTPPVSPPQGNTGGRGASGCGSGGGGGATVAGSNAPGNSAGAGGAGATSSINGTPTARGGGGGGSAQPTSSGPAVRGAGGTGGGGAGAGSGTSGNQEAGTVNTGGGGGGGPANAPPHTGGAGGSGIVVIRYKFQN